MKIECGETNKFFKRKKTKKKVKKHKKCSEHEHGDVHKFRNDDKTFYMDNFKDLRNGHDSN